MVSSCSLLSSVVSLFWILSVSTGVQSFTTSPFRIALTKQRQQTTPQFATIEKSQGLTEEDEDILFGGTEVPDQPLPNEKVQDPLVGKLMRMRESIQYCPQIWGELSKHCPDKRALLDEHLCDDKVDVTFKEMNQIVLKSASIFKKHGVKKGSNVAILGENCAKWLMLDHGIQLAGGASAVRGADAPLEELRYIYEHSQSAGLVVLQGPKLLRKLGKDAQDKDLPKLGLSNEKYGEVKTVILMHREKKTDVDIAQMASEYGVKIELFENLLAKAEPLADAERPTISKEDIATIVYTSGTTGRPKGVMLSHGNLIHQTSHRLNPSKPYEEGEPLPGELMLSLLPVWHITERTFELWMASRGCSVVYSSIRTFKNDLAKHQPQWMVLVPRVLEKVANGVQDKFSSGSAVVKTLAKFFTSIGSKYCQNKNIVDGLVVGDSRPSSSQKLMSKLKLAVLSPLHAVGSKLVWSKVQAGFGGRLKLIISGGSALAGSLESFYETAGIPICVGYGLTECSPLISYRRQDSNLVTAGCAGKPCWNTEMRVVDPNSKGPDRASLPIGEVGVVIARGPQVMQGYFRNPEATEQAIQGGWFDTGDLGKINPATGDLILTGRAKDTIVLSNGENIEPTPIEDSILESPLVDQVMLTGQDGRRLLAIVVLNPSELAAAGYISSKEASEIGKLQELVNDPKCSFEEAEPSLKKLKEASVSIRKNSDLNKKLMADISKATSSFRSWEKVSVAYTTLEPFAMSNDQLTQSYKVKRASVSARYESELPK